MSAAMSKTRSLRRANSKTPRKPTRRPTVPPDILRSLTVIPGIGPSLAADLYGLGIQSVAALKRRDPEVLYQQLMRQVGGHADRCVLYAFLCAVYFAAEAHPDSEKLKWWNWKD
jgi:predicted flap endonuclease-1-like 5' DNA nuclease